MNTNRKREDGFYWVKWKDNTWTIGFYCFWGIGHWECGSFNGLDSDFAEIDERRIVRENPLEE